MITSINKYLNIMVTCTLDMKSIIPNNNMSLNELGASYCLQFTDEDRKSAAERQSNVERLAESCMKEVIVNQPQNPYKGYATNIITTSKYKWWNFLFLFLYENINPFNKFANFYFVCVAIMETMPRISLTHGIPQSLGALSFVLFVDAMTSLHDDINRHKADKIVNSTQTEVLNTETKCFEPIEQGALQVGNIVKVKEGEIFPADLLFIRSGDPKATKSCWINTKSLDGETDNKYRQALKVTSECDGVPINSSAAELSSLKGKVKCELPNNMTSDFNGTFMTQTLQRGEITDVKEKITIKNMLLRGCILKNTTYIYGIVISAGIDTKVEFVIDKKKWWQFGKGHKMASLSKRLNQVIFMMICALIFLCILGAFGEKVLSRMIIENTWYIRPGRFFILSFWSSFFRFFLLCYQFIPVSLYVTMSCIYSAQGFFMQNDLRLYDEVNDEPMRVRTTNLNDDLGQVGYIFTDKTGTLTANLMQFRKCIVDGVSYGLGDSDIGRSVKAKKDACDEESMRSNSTESWNSKREAVDVVTPVKEPPTGVYRYTNFQDGSESHPSHTLEEDLRQGDDHADKLINFLINMAINHTVIMENKEDGTLELNASSPDEQAFVSGSYCLGVQFLGMDYESNIIKLNVLGKYLEIKVLYMLPYESTRKRMSIIVQMPDNSICLYCKGADSVMFELRSPDSNSSRFIENLSTQVGCWAEEAFRTMVFGYKRLTETEFKSWMQLYESLCDDVEEKELRKLKKPNRIDLLEMKMESGLTLQGATAVEDSLQQGVPEALAQLSEAGIHIWMITGDKCGTAKNIAVACNLLKLPDMKLIEFTKEAMDASLLAKDARPESLTERISPSAIQEIEWEVMELEKTEELEKANVILGEFESVHPGLLAARLYCEALATNILNKSASTLGQPIALVVDELFIDFLALSCRQAFLVVAQSCKVVIACRARKDQKAKLTRLVRSGNKEVVTLGIGDGANDVEMIRAAHIGVGIIGKEGTQAVNNADYAIGQFRFLSRLILVYGHRSYHGITLAALLIFYKNILFTLIQYLYTLLCGFSGTRHQSFVAVTFYNTAFTAFPPFFIGVWDKDINDSNCYRFPQIHRLGIRHRMFTKRIFMISAIKAIYESFVATYFTSFCLQNIVYESGTIEVYAFGVVMTAIVVLIANLTASAVQSISSCVSFTAFYISFGLFIGGICLLSELMDIQPYYYKYGLMLLKNPSTYLIVILVVSIAILPTFMIHAVIFEVYPTLANLIQDVQIRHANPDMLKKAIAEQEKRRSVKMELKTIKSLPTDTSTPSLLEEFDSTIQSADASTQLLSPGENTPVSSQITVTANTHRSIRSIAGIRALSICDQLHGPSYDAQSVNEEAQNELINRINSHGWRDNGKKNVMGTVKSALEYTGRSILTAVTVSFPKKGTYNCSKIMGYEEDGVDDLQIIEKEQLEQEALDTILEDELKEEVERLEKKTH